jgi:hypothetical protein
MRSTSTLLFALSLTDGAHRRRFSVERAPELGRDRCCHALPIGSLGGFMFFAMRDNASVSVSGLPSSWAYPVRLGDSRPSVHVLLGSWLRSTEVLEE